MYTQRDLQREKKGIIIREIPMENGIPEKRNVLHKVTLWTLNQFLVSPAEFFCPVRLQWEISSKKAGICRKGTL